MSGATVSTRVRKPFAALVVVATAAAGLGAFVMRIVAPAPILRNTFGFGNLALVGFVAFGLAFSAVGALLVVRRPDNAVGWLMTVTGLCYAGAALGAAVTYAAVGAASTSDPIAGWAGWLTVLLATLGGAIFLLALIFPDGRGATPAWHRFTLVFSAGMAITIVSFLVQPGPLQLFPDVGNPLPIGPDLRPVLGYQASQLTAQAAALFAPLIAWAMVVRYRRSDVTVRRQLKWFVFSMTVSIGAISAAALASTVTDRPPEAALALFGFGGAFVAVAIGIAILRYHLYDIDRLISRTLGYAVITGILGVVFIGVILLLTAVAKDLVQGAIPSNQGQTIAVAISTLVVFALFQPVRRRVQRAIDRRFDRANYDSERTVAAFAGRLRNDVDLAAVSLEIVATATTAVHPTQATVWLRGAHR